MNIVVKVGGDLLIEGFPKGLVDELEVLNKAHGIVLVHGGGDIVTDIAKKLGHEPRFVLSPRGFRSRYTDKQTAEIYTMVMAGKINKEIISALQGRGVAAVGLSGLDGGLIRARRKKQIIVVDERGRKMLIDGGYTGQIEGVNCSLLCLLIKNGFMPVVSPVAMGEEAESLNVDGDRTAASLASALKAERLILLTDVEGLRLGGKYIDEMHISEAKRALDQVGAGMITKVYAAIEAVEGGVGAAVIASGLRDSAISSALEHKSGTVIKK
jgi:acetylglutamate/LysW-gamma-L-alpha-aminoadipate kinase